MILRKLKIYANNQCENRANLITKKKRFSSTKSIDWNIFFQVKECFIRQSCLTVLINSKIIIFSKYCELCYAKLY